jgi:hypothetical protein
VIDVVKKIAQGHDDWKLGGCDSILINIVYQKNIFSLKSQLNPKEGETNVHDS